MVQPPRIRNSNRPNNTLKAFLLIIGVVVGSLLSLAMQKIGDGLTGAGHGVYGPYSIFGSPMGFFFWAWPLVLPAVFSKIQFLVKTALLALVIHYSWILVHFQDVPHLLVDYRRLDEEGQWLMQIGFSIYFLCNGVMLFGACRWWFTRNQKASWRQLGSGEE
jgi:hypothetical protein